MRVVTLVGMVVVTGLVLAGCGKKTAPIPPEDVPPGKQERSISSSRGYIMQSFLTDEVTQCNS